MTEIWITRTEITRTKKQQKSYMKFLTINNDFVYQKISTWKFCKLDNLSCLESGFVSNGISV